MKIVTAKNLFLDAVKDLKRNITLAIVLIFTISIVLMFFAVFILYMLIVSINIGMLSGGSIASIVLQKCLLFITVVLLPPLSLIIVVNEFKISTYTKRREISIMKLVGATNKFIILPFIFQGIVIGVIAAFVGILPLYFIYNLVFLNITKWGLGLVLIEPSVLIKKMFFLFIIVGILLGILGNVIALRKVLKSSY